MNPKLAAVLNIVVALIFAAAIIVLDLIFEGSEHNETIRNTMIALWFVPFSYLSSCATGCWKCR